MFYVTYQNGIITFCSLNKHTTRRQLATNNNNNKNDKAYTFFKKSDAINGKHIVAQI